MIFEVWQLKIVWFLYFIFCYFFFDYIGSNHPQERRTYPEDGKKFRNQTPRMSRDDILVILLLILSIPVIHEWWQAAPDCLP